jgi:hypothetical protein
MKKSKKLFAALACITMLAVAAHYASRRVEPLAKQIVPGESESKAKRYLNSLLIGGPSDCVVYEPSKEPSRKERAWKLYQLWLARHERDVTKEVIPFLQDEDGLLRNTAARLLGRLENPAGEQPLQELNYRIEVARNRTRGLKGRAKVTAFANELDLSFDQVVQLTEKLRVERLKGRGNGSEGEKIVKELVDMLYVMSKRGESIEPLVQNMTLLPAQRILLQGAALPPEKEAQLIVDYLSKLDTVTTEDYELALFYLPSLGVISTDVMIRRLEQMKESPSRWGRHGYVTLFRALS